MKHKQKSPQMTNERLKQSNAPKHFPIEPAPSDRLEFHPVFTLPSNWLKAPNMANNLHIKHNLAHPAMAALIFILLSLSGDSSMAASMQLAARSLKSRVDDTHTSPKKETLQRWGTLIDSTFFIPPGDGPQPPPGMDGANEQKRYKERKACVLPQNAKRNEFHGRNGPFNVQGSCASP